MYRVEVVNVGLSEFKPNEAFQHQQQQQQYTSNGFWLLVNISRATLNLNIEFRRR